MNGLISLENLSIRPVSEEILALNEVSKEYGLILSEEDAKDLSETRNTALVENARVEMGVGAVEKLIRRFCRSRYVTNENYAGILNRVTELFYYIKTDTNDGISDNDLIRELFMRFELYCRGSVDTLESREAERIIRKVNSGEKYTDWYRERDELDQTAAPQNLWDEERYHDDELDGERRYEYEDDPLDNLDAEEDYDDLDAFDEFFDREAVMQREKRSDPTVAIEYPDDEEDDDDE